MSTQQKKSLRRLASTLVIETSNIFDGDYVEHHGILGQKWGIRRFQNKDGSLKQAGKGRYSSKGSEEKRDKGLAPGVSNDPMRSGGLGKLAAAAGIAALAGSSVGPTMKALGSNKKSYKEMDDDELIKDNKRKALENKYKQNHGIKDSPEDIANSASKGLEAVKKYRDAGKPQSNPNQNRYNTRQTLTQKEMDALSDQDLQKLVNRLNLETQYSRLTTEPQMKSRVDVGLERTQAVLAIVGSAATIGVAAANLHSKMGGKGASAATSLWEKAH